MQKEEGIGKKHNPGILDWLYDWLVKPIAFGAIGAVDTLIRTIQTLPSGATINDLISAITKPPEPEAPIPPGLSPSEVHNLLNTNAWKQVSLANRVNQIIILAETASLGLIDISLVNFLSRPDYKASQATAQAVLSSRYDVAISEFVRRFWLKTYTPLLPGYADMISIYVREGYLEEKWVEIPPEFTEFMKELGFSEDWTKRLWGQHWVLPGVTLLYEMFHKKIIDYKTMVQMLKYHDFEPVWRDRLIQNAYSLIPRVDLRRGYAWGMIPGEQLQDRYERLGFTAADAATMTGIAKRFGLTAYYSRLLAVAAATFRKGQLSGEDFQRIMEVCGLPGEAQDLLLSAETMAREAAVTQPGEEPRTLSAAQICAAYTKGLLSLSAAKDRLVDLGFLEGDADLLLALATPKPVAEAPATEIVSAASLLYRNGWMGPEEFTGWLRKANLSLEEIAVQKDAQDLRYWFDYASDLLALWKQMYAKDLITLDEFYTNLLTWGCQPDRAWAIVSLEETRKIPKPRVAG